MSNAARRDGAEEETAIMANPKPSGALVLRLIVGLALLGCPRVGAAQGTWSVISLPRQPAEVLYPTALAVDTAGNLYVADTGNAGMIQQRNVQGNWSILATSGSALGQVDYPSALAVDAAGSLYVAERSVYGRIQKRNAQGNWSVVAAFGSALGQVYNPLAIAADGAGNLYVAEGWLNNVEHGRIQKRDAQGNWTEIATGGSLPGPIYWPYALAADTAGNLYLAEGGHGIQKRDTQGNWSVIAPQGAAALAVDTAGSLYVADTQNDRIQKRDAQGHWSVIAGYGSAPGQVDLHQSSPALAVDSGDNLYVAEQRNNRIQKRDALENWSVLTTRYGNTAGQTVEPTALAVDRAGNLYVAEHNFDFGVSFSRLQKRDVQGNWMVIATGPDPGQVNGPRALAVDTTGNLYVADYPQLQKRDAQGEWSVSAEYGWDLGQVHYPSALAADGAGNLYVADRAIANEDDFFRDSRIQKRDAQGNWDVIATQGLDLGGVYGPSALAVDAAGNLYVAEWQWSNGGRIQKRDAQGNWSLIATDGLAVGQVASPSGLGLDGAGNLYVAETGTNRVQRYTPGR